MRISRFVLLSFCLSALLVASAPATLLFPLSDSMPSGGSQLAWTNYDGTPYDSVESFSPSSPGGDGYAMAVTDGSGWQYLFLAEDDGLRQDYTISADVYIPDSSGADWTRVGVFARANEIAYTAKSYYMFADSDGGTYLRVGKYSELNHGTWVNFVDSGGGPSYTPGSWHNFSLTVKGATISAKFDGTQFYSGTDPEPLVRGYMGIIVYQATASSAVPHVDNVKITSAAGTGYIYVAGGGLDDASSANPADGTPTGDAAIYSVLVGDVDIATGQISNWRYTSQNLPETNASSTPYSYLYMGNNAHVYNGYLYVGPGDWNGDSSATTADIVCYAKIKANGDLEPFAHSAPIVDDADDLAINGTAIVEVGGNAYYYSLGGTGSGSNIVAYAKINPADGSLGTWNTTTVLVSGDWFNAGTGIGNQIFNVSGNLRSPSGRFVDHATVAADGTVGTWSTQTYDATAGNVWATTINTATSPGGNSFAILAGGNNSTVYGHVFTSPLTAGVPGAWTLQTESYPGNGRGIALVTADDLLIGLVGTTGANTGSATTDVYTARIDDAGVVQNWTAATPLIQPRGWSGCAFFRTEYLPAPLGTQAMWTLYQ